MSNYSVLGVLALAAICSLIGLLISHALWDLEIDGEAVAVALVITIAPTCEGIRMFNNLQERRQQHGKADG